MKQEASQSILENLSPAAFGRLRVETFLLGQSFLLGQPAAFGRLRVETGVYGKVQGLPSQPPSGGCVLKPC